MIEIIPVGIVKSERTEIRDDHWQGQSQIIIAEEHGAEALLGIDSFSHLQIIFQFHLIDKKKYPPGPRHPRSNPKWPMVGIFARRGKNRPNHLGLTTVKLDRVDGRTLWVTGLDALDGSPVIDIKPVMRGFMPVGDIHQPEWAFEIMKDYWD